MSDIAQGPGWWQASDGKWYPPQEQAPQAPPPPAAPGYAPPPGAAPPYTPGPGVPQYGYAPVPVDSQGRPLAEWWQRLVAIFLDGLIVGVVYWVLVAIVVSSSIGSDSFTHFGIKLWLVDVVVGVAGIAYFALLEGSARGQSLGQMALGIAVRDVATGGPITPQRAGIRMVILYPWLVLIWIPLIGPFLGFIAEIWTLVCGLSPLWNSGRQGYHDISQKTTVIKVR